MDTYIDAKDSKDFIISHIYLLFGCIWPLIFFFGKKHFEIFEIKLLGISSLCVGDSFVF